MPAQQCSIQYNGAAIRYLLIRSKRRRKTLHITFHPRHGVIVAAPQNESFSHIESFVLRHAKWILKNYGRHAYAPSPIAFAAGDTLPYLGRSFPLTVNPPKGLRRPQISFDDCAFTLDAPDYPDPDSRRAAIARAFETWYRRHALEYLGQRVTPWSAAMGLKPAEVIVREQRHRWGSCTAKGVLRFNWRLIQLDPEIIDYVVVHELAHLAVLNHSPRFWQRVERSMPDYRDRLKRLRSSLANVAL
ncbi:MAG: M48 family metallopeptidase [SAR202 cluster bacterium]|nr:M48 family metallopeptidase [SAR202 cluster bacterium]